MIRNSSILLFFIFLNCSVFAQQNYNEEERIETIRQELESLSVSDTGLTERVDFNVSGVSIQEFLRALAESNDLNISVDPALDLKVYNNFTNESVKNILLFLAKQYQLDIAFTGSIMYISKFIPPEPPAPVIKPKEILVDFNSYNNLLTLDLSNDTLSAVAEKITRQTKKNVIVPTALSNQMVSGFIQNMPFESAIEKMAFINGLKVLKTKDNFFVITNPENEEELLLDLEGGEPESSYDNPFPPFDRQKKTGPVSPGDLFIDVREDTMGEVRVSLEAIDVPIQETIQAVAEAVGVSYFLYSNVKGNITTRVLNLDFDEFLGRLLKGTDYTYKMDNNLYLIGERKLEGLRANKVIQLQYRSLDEVMQVIPADLQQGVEVKEFKELNSLLVSGSYPQIMEIEAFVNAIDRVVPMVMIEVIIMDIRKGRSVKTGIKAGISDTVQTGGSIFPGLDFTFGASSINNFLDQIGVNNTVNLGQVSPDFYVALSALEDNNNVEVRSVPKLSTLNGHTATLAIGSQRYYVNTTQNVTGGLQPTTVVTQQFVPVEANLGITIEPVVTGDEQVTLNLDVSNSDFLELNDDAPPAKAISQFNSMMRVHNEEMIVLGGLERIEKGESGQGVPILSRIPILKWLFSSRTKNRQKTVTLVFIKPTIIY